MMALSRTPARAFRFPLPDHELTEFELARIARYWLRKPEEMRRMIYVRYLVDHGRIGKGDRN